MEAITSFPDFVAEEKINNQRNIISMSRNHFIFDIEIEDFKIHPIKDQVLDVGVKPDSITLHRQTIKDQKRFEKALCFPHIKLKDFGKQTNINSGNE